MSKGPAQSTRPTKEGGLIAHASTPWGSFVAEWDKEGTLVREKFTRVQYVKPKPYRSKDCGKKSAKGPQPPWHARVLPPGDFIHYLVSTLTLGIVRPCVACNQRRGMLNEAGWLQWPLVLLKPRFWRIVPNQ
jgi:hypothetical protein|tara:strand:- start:814 stop:1209 length:396 start_codon:yes stop_codon:yes gene_type:complete